MKVTICIPCFNAARWVRQCVQSALDQQGIEPEVIVVDDGSTDGSAEIIREFGDRVTLLVGEKRGAPHARNLAWRHGSGEWVQFLDADDWLEPGKIATQLHEAPDAEIIHSPIWIENWTETGSTRERSQTAPDEDIFTQWITWQIQQTGCALWRRTTLESLGGWKEGQPCCQEHELYMRAIIAQKIFRYAPTAGAVYRIWSEGTLCRKDPRLVARVRTGLIDNLLAWLKENGKLTSKHLAAAGQVFFETARTWARFDLAEAAAYAAERKARGPYCVTGPAAPRSYRIIHGLVGFTWAEKIARSIR